MSKQLYQITEKGQVTIPAELRDNLGIKKGTNVLFQQHSPNQIVMTIVNEEHLAASLASATVLSNPTASAYERTQPIVKETIIGNQPIRVHVQGARITRS